MSQPTTRYRILDGLPPYGPMAIGFPEAWAKHGHEGLVVKFSDEDGEIWVGNFAGGPGGKNDVLMHPDGVRVLVASYGALWCVDPDARTAEEIASFVELIQLDNGDLLVNDSGLAFFRLGADGVQWRTSQISWDGFRNIQVGSNSATGEAYSPFGDLWLPFRLDLETGEHDGGSFTEPASPLAKESAKPPKSLLQKWLGRLPIIAITLPIVYTLVIGTLTLMPHIEDYVNEKDFDSEQWKNWEESETQWRLRWDMVDDLMDHYQLVGMNRSEVVDLLGDADSEGAQEMRYYLGMTRNWIATGSLVLTLDENDVVVIVNVHSG